MASRLARALGSTHCRCVVCSCIPSGAAHRLVGVRVINEAGCNTIAAPRCLADKQGARSSLCGLAGKTKLAFSKTLESAKSWLFEGYASQPTFQRVCRSATMVGDSAIRRLRLSTIEKPLVISRYIPLLPNSRALLARRLAPAATRPRRNAGDDGHRPTGEKHGGPRRGSRRAGARQEGQVHVWPLRVL